MIYNSLLLRIFNKLKKNRKKIIFKYFANSVEFETPKLI